MEMVVVEWATNGPFVPYARTEFMTRAVQQSIFAFTNDKGNLRKTPLTLDSSFWTCVVWGQALCVDGGARWGRRL